MKMLVISIYDSKVKMYGTPSFVLNRGSALRSWEEMVNDGKSDVSKYPNDFSLFELGEWDAEKGVFSPLPAKNNLGLAKEFINGQPRANIPLSATDLQPVGVR